MDIPRAQELTSSHAPQREGASGAFLIPFFLTIQVNRVKTDKLQLFPCKSRQETVRAFSPSFFRPWSLAKDLQNPGTWSGSAARCKTLASSKGQ